MVRPRLVQIASALLAVVSASLLLNTAFATRPWLLDGPSILDGAVAERGFWLLLALLPLILGIVALLRSWVVIEVDGRSLTVRRFGGPFARTYGEADIAQWRIHGRTEAKTLIIRFKDGATINLAFYITLRVPDLVSYLETIVPKLRA